MTSSAKTSRSLSIRYQLNRPAFELDVDLDLSMQGVTGLFGPSGAGKTTLLRCMAGLEKSDAGRLVVDGAAWEDSGSGRYVASHKRQIAYVFQEARLFPHLNVSRNLEYGQRRSVNNGAFMVSTRVWKPLCWSSRSTWRPCASSSSRSSPRRRITLV